VLQSAEVMKKAVSYLENFLARKEGTTKGTVVLATVNGDVTTSVEPGSHDLEQQRLHGAGPGQAGSGHTIIEAAQQHNADAIGLSALLVSTSKQMPLIVNELARRGLSYPVIIGGAAINRAFGRRILFLEDAAEPYAPGVFYCKDAFEGLGVMDQLTGGEDKRAALLARIEREARAEMNRPTPVVRERRREDRPSTVDPAPDIPTPPFWGARAVLDIPLESVYPHINRPELFRLNWGARNAHGAEWESASRVRGPQVA